jgi:hypothetical protein
LELPAADGQLEHWPGARHRQLDDDQAGRAVAAVDAAPGELAAEAGIPEGVFNVIPGSGETARQALGRHMDVDAITFTG